MNIPLPPLTWSQAFQYCHDPRLLRFHFRHVKAAYQLAAELSGGSIAQAQRFHRELCEDELFLRQVLGAFARETGQTPRGSDFMYLTRIDSKPPWQIVREEAGGFYFHAILLYIVVRAVNPEIVVETGGTPGFSSAFILRAMDRNVRGTLHTVDLPPTGDLAGLSGKDGVEIHAGLPDGKTSGWIIPDDLRARHQQHLGDARDLLPGVLDAAKPLDIFIHDSDHSYDHMMWEFEQSFPVIRSGGAVLSDDVGDNSSFQDFVRFRHLKGLYAGGFGAARLP